MEKSKFKSILEKSLYIVLGVGAILGVSIGCYKIYSNLFKTSVLQANSNWNNMPAGFKEFSEKNSLKVQFHIPSKSSNNAYYNINGTAWTWYWEKNSTNSSYDWYLITNFHVVNEAVAYSLGLINENNGTIAISDYDSLIDYYKKQSEFKITPSYFDLFWCDLNIQPKDENDVSNYIPVFPTVSDAIKNVSVIADFQNNNIKLFSESKIETEEQSYNLDMALIKVTINSSVISNPSSLTSPINNYINNKNNNDEFDENLNIYISGNPSHVSNNENNPGMLVGVELSSKFLRDYKQLIQIEDRILKLLKAPYFYSKDDYIDFPLSGGASGSAVYQHSSEILIEWTKKIPVGIYWGGQLASNLMKPSFIPFIVNSNEITYNIFQNFIDFISTK